MNSIKNGPLGSKDRDYHYYDTHDEQEIKSLLANEVDCVCEDTPKETVAATEKDIQRPEDNNDKSSCASLPYLGLIMAVFSSLFFSLCSLIVKIMENVDPLQLAAFRFVGIFLPTIPIVIYNRVPPFGPPKKRGLLFLRAVCGAMGLMMQFYAIRHMPLADASVIIFSTPVFVVIFARIFLKESCEIFNVVVIIFTLLGVVLITKPPFLFGDGVYLHGYTADMMQGAIVAFVSTIFNANVYVLLRWLKGIHYAVIMMNFSVVAITMSFAACYFFGSITWLWGLDLLWMLPLAVFSFAGQTLKTISLQYEQASPVAICRTGDIVFAFIWQMLFFHQIPNWFSLGGAILVTLSVILTAVQKWYLNLSEESRWKGKLKMFLWLRK